MKHLYLIRGRKKYYLILDTIIIFASYGFSYFIKFYPDLKNYLNHLTPEYFLILLISYIFSFYFFQSYRILWTYSNINDIYKLITSNITGFFLSISIISILHIPYSRMLIILSFMFISTLTIFYRILLRDFYSRKRANIPESLKTVHISTKLKRKILIAGAGEAGRIILSEYNKIGLGKQIIGFVDDNKQKKGEILNGKKILGRTGLINEYIDEYGIDEILIAMPSIESENINRIVKLIREKSRSIPIKILPSFAELADKNHLTPSLREVSFVDFINRDEIHIDTKIIHKKFSNKTVLITGAGGSIGAEICKQLLKFNVKKIIALGRGENSIYNLVKTLNEYIKYMDNKPAIEYRIADIKDEKLLDTIFNKYKPDIVFHAAAHKHVPLMEFNEYEALQNNVMGTKNILEISCKYKINNFVLISTDKAVHPTNIMGATKRLAELITGYYNTEKGLKTSIVRFGNVFGSRGSVIPLFNEQIKKGGPVTVTHPEITRFFMSIPEASLLVINAASYSNGGELYVLDMGKPYKIVDIVNRMIELHGYRPNKDIKIKFTGLRPGEKMYEELFYDKTRIKKTNNEKIFMMESDSISIDKDAIEHFMNNEIHNIIKYDALEIRKMIKKLLPFYAYEKINLTDDIKSRLVN